MTKNGLIYFVLTWIFVMVINHYYDIGFSIIWFGLSLFLLIITFDQIIKILKEGEENISLFRILKSFVYGLLFILTLFRTTDLWIEKIDFIIFENKRNEIILQVFNNELKPNVSWNDILCELPFEFPVVSNGGNDILIYKNNDKIKVVFYIFRNIFIDPSTYLIFTNDEDEMSKLEEQIEKKPYLNWKIKENWYRIVGV